MAYRSSLRLPKDVERGASGGPGFKTTILPLSGGKEKRNIEWGRPRGEWDVGYGIDSKTAFNVTLEFFYVMEGAAHSFPFKDWSDYEIGVDATDTDQQIGIGDNAQTAFQIVRRYTAGSVTYDRPVQKPVSGTLRVFLNSVEQFAGFTTDLDTGIITFTPAPGPGVSVGVICEFDVPVRFKEDNMELAMAIFNAGSIPSLPVIEVKDE